MTIKQHFTYLKFTIILIATFGKLSAQVITIPIETSSKAVVLQVGADKQLRTIYMGQKLADSKEYESISNEYKQTEDHAGLLNSAYTPSGARNLVEPAITVTHTDGNQSLDLRYVSHEVKTVSEGVSLLTVTLQDNVYNFYVTLCYKSYNKNDVIEQWSIIRHNEKSSVTLQKFASANLHIKGNGFWLKQFHGDWAKEMQPEESKLTHGIKTIDSKLGTRANLFMPSVFAISMGSPAHEDEGSVLLGGLEWSGNFKVDFEVDNQDNLRLIAGMNNYASAYKLKAGDEFATPPLVYTLSNQGTGYASRNLQSWARNFKILEGKGNRLTLLNNWEATYFDFNEQKLGELLKDTRKLGVDLFLLDDGWFGNNYPRNGDNAGLGDWQENRKKLPNGIASIARQAAADGVKFGIWIEPEMVNPKSNLYKNHPDWVVKQPKRDEYYFRNQLALDLSNPKVQDFVYHIVDSLFIKAPSLAYIKWDCNAVIYNAYSVYLKSEQSNFYVEYVRGLYKVLQKIRAKYPTVPIMLCSGGGGRVDYGALQYFTEFWPSDNTDPMERIFIQWNYSYFYPAIATSAHVTDWGKQPIKFRTDVAMMGKLGFDIVLDKLSSSDMQFCQQAVVNYNSIKEVIWHGDQYRLRSPYEHNMASMMYVDEAKTSAVIFNYLVNNRYGESSRLPVKLKGLDPQKRYRIEEVNVYPGTRTSINSNFQLSGDFLMNVGINPDVNAQRTSVILKIVQVK
ncbi:alpha-galactosidase [Mucilaginibacter terrae]|uniref:Alpha-galactosidase n=1 Tax=Mucilaginibacter terrae TaxID=1955052 RepID=A0ABU3H0E4_9SPHI|nr:alpha-galactosidase [Mucilaginibacter terrae]MDT3405385.1 alpha-galactosidase [Mucilaginibacter terrae]